MSKTGAKLYKGHLSHAASASDPHEDMDTGKPPRVGQSSSYASGSNAHGNQAKTKSPPRDPSREMPMSGPSQPRGWNSKTSR
jgi:hypothetical protein